MLALTVVTDAAGDLLLPELDGLLAAKRGKQCTKFYPV